MKLSAFEESLKGTELDVPFLNEFLKQSTFNEPQLIRMVRESDKGLLVFGANFKVFVWSSEELLGWILNIIQESLLDASMPTALYMIPHPEAKRRCLIARDEESQGSWDCKIPRCFTYTLDTTLPVQGELVEPKPKASKRSP
jgi:hypothetical protein